MPARTNAIARGLLIFSHMLLMLPQVAGERQWGVRLLLILAFHDHIVTKFNSPSHRARRDRGPRPCWLCDQAMTTLS